MTRKRERAGLSRRDFLKTLGVGAGAAVLSGCAPDLFLPAPNPTAAASATLTPFQPSLPTNTPTKTLIPTLTHTPWPSATPTSTPFQWSLPTQEPTAGPAPASGEGGDGEEGGTMVFALWDHQLAMYDYKPRNLKRPVPETVPLLSGATMRLTSDWTDYWRGILRLLNPNMEKSDFESSWNGLVADARAFTNNSGPDSGNFGLHSLTCGGATHVLASPQREGAPEGKYYRIYTLDYSKGPPSLSAGIDITRHFMATTGSNKRLKDGSYAVYGFPQFENPIVPLLSPEGTDLIEVSRVKLVSSVQRPYNT